MQGKGEVLFVGRKLGSGFGLTCICGLGIFRCWPKDFHILNSADSQSVVILPGRAVGAWVIYLLVIWSLGEGRNLVM